MRTLRSELAAHGAATSSEAECDRGLIALLELVRTVHAVAERYGGILMHLATSDTGLRALIDVAISLNICTTSNFWNFDLMVSFNSSERNRNCLPLVLTISLSSPRAVETNVGVSNFSQALQVGIARFVHCIPNNWQVCRRWPNWSPFGKQNSPAKSCPRRRMNKK